MKENKYKYYFKDTQGNFSTEVFTLEEIERGCVQEYYKVTWAHYNAIINIVARCQFTGYKDLFEGDIFKYPYVYTEYQDNGFDNGVGWESHNECVDVDIRNSLLEIYFDNGAFRVRSISGGLDIDKTYNFLSDYIKPYSIEELMENKDIQVQIEEDESFKEEIKNWKIEVIGNTITNPDLLGAGKQYE